MAQSVPDKDGLEWLQAGWDALHRGETEAAFGAFAEAIRSDHYDAVPAGLWWSASCLQDRGDHAGAGDYFRRVIDTGHPGWTPRAELSLATMLDDQGNVAEAREHYERVHGEVISHVATARLAVMLTHHGEHDSARDVYERATDHGQLDKRVRFAFNRADAWKRRGNLAAAAECLREIVTGNWPRAPEAAYMLGNVLRDDGDLDGARAAFQYAADSGDPDLAAQAASMQRHCV